FFKNALAVAFVKFGGQAVGMLGGFFHGLLQARTDIFRQAFPPLGVGDHHVVDHAMVGVGNGFLDFVKLLGVNIGPGVFLTIDHAGLQGLIDLGKGQLLRVGAERTELLFENVRSLNTELQAFYVLGTGEFVFVGGQLLHAVVPVGQPLKAAVLHAVQQALSGVALLEAIDGVHVVKQEGEVKDLDFFGVAVKFGQRRCDDMDVAKQQRLHFLGVAKEL